MTTKNELGIGEVTVDTSKAKSQLEGLGKTFDSTVNNMEAKGKTADPLGPMTEKAEKAAEKLSRTEKAMVNLIQRSTAELNTMGKGQAAYLTEISKIKGIDPALIEPYIAKLREAEKAQEAARASLGNMGMTAKATSAALRQVPADFQRLGQRVPGS